MKAGKAGNTSETATKKVAVRRRNTQKSAMIQQTAQVTGKSERHVRRVVNGMAENKEVELVYQELHEGTNKLLEAVKTLVPFAGYQDIELEVGYKKFS